MTQGIAPLLVVDDNPASRDLLTRRLVRSGFPVVVASNGPDALRHLSLHRVSIVLLDCHLAGMSGLEVLRTIRESWTSERLPVLMVTALDEAHTIATALDLGANDYIARPVDFPVALARVRAHVSRSSAEERLRASEERYALAAEGANDGLWDWDLETNEIRYATRWKAIVGCADEEIADSPDEWFGRVHTEDLGRLRHDLDAHLAGHTPHFECEHRMRHKSGAFRWVHTRGLAIRAADGSGAVRMAGSQADITEGKVVDALTGLPNRMLLLDRLDQVLHHHRAHPGAEFAVLFLDLDGFKTVNDNLGHLSGDALLQAVARRLEGSLRQTDIVTRPRDARPDTRPASTAEHTLARLGGDEFVVLLHEVRGVVDATRVAERIQRALARPFQFGGKEVFTSVSIGIAVGATGYTRPDEVLRDADTAMYRAKALGKGRSEVFDCLMREQVIERFQLDAALRLALERHEFLPHYQPIVNLETGRLYGFEALLRWQHPRRGLVLPGEFVPALEDNGLVLPVGRQFFRDVCAQLRAWNTIRSADAPLSLSVNFASHQFFEAGLLEYLLEMLEDAEIAPSQLLIEITEATAIGHLTRTCDMLQRLRDAGIRVVLDDFGTGYSSLACLHELPIAGLKLDRAFVGRETRHPAILEAIVRLADRLGLSVTAEGVETAAQCEELRALGCAYAQGYLFAKPMDAEGAAEWIKQDGIWLPDARPALASN